MVNSSAASQTLTNEAVSVTASPIERLEGVKGYASCEFKTNASDYKIQVWDGTYVLGEDTIPSSTSKQVTGVYFPVPDSGTISLRIISGSDAADLAIDKCFLGTSNAFQVSQAVAYGSLSYSGACSGDWNNTTASTYTDAAAVTGCTQVLTGKVASTGSQVLQIALNSAPKGTYDVSFSGNMKNPSASQAAGCRMIDTEGSPNTLASTPSFTAAAGTYVSMTLHGQVTYTDVGNRTIKIQCKPGASGGNAGVSSAEQATFTVRYFPSASDTAYTFDTTASSWTGYHTTAGATWSRTNTAYGDMTPTGTAAIVQRTNTNFGTVTTAASNLPGITFTPKGAYKYSVCAYVKASVGAANAYGAFKLTDGTTDIAESGIRDAANYFNSMPVCGQYQANGVSPVTLKLQCKADTNACEIAIPTNAISVIEWEIIAINQSFPAPVVAAETRNEVIMDTYTAGSQFATTNTQVFRYSNTHVNTGTAFTPASSATLGHTITLNEDGLYCANGNFVDSGAASNFQISRNAITVGTNDGILCSSGGQSGAARNHNSCSSCFIGAQGDVIRALGTGTADQNSSAGSPNGFIRILKMSR